jgi:hypothetical protein
MLSGGFKLVFERPVVPKLFRGVRSFKVSPLLVPVSFAVPDTEPELPEAPPELPPDEPPPLCASADVELNATTEANAIVLNLMVISLTFLTRDYPPSLSSVPVPPARY